MFSAIPHDELSSDRLPWVTWSLVAACAAGAIATAAGFDVQGARLGVDPGALSPQGFACYWLFSESLLHALVTGALLLALGPHLQALWGAKIYAGFLALSALLSAAVYAAIGAQGRPLVGASGLVTAAIAALITRHGMASLRTWLLLPGSDASFELPVYAPLGAWFVGEVLLTATDAGSGPTRGLGAIVPIAGALCGIGSALAARKWQLEEPLEAGEARSHPALAAAQAARDAGRPSAAVGILEPAVRARPQDAELVRALCDAACTADEASRAAEPLRRFIHEQVRVGETSAAAAFWRAFGTRVPSVRLDPRTALPLAEALAAAGDRPLAARMLRDALAASPRMSPGVAMRFAEVAAPLHRETALRAGKIALAAEGLDEAKRAKLASRVAALEASGTSESDSELDLELARPPAAPAIRAAAKPKPMERVLDVELDPMYAGAGERPSELPPPVEKAAVFELSADGSKVSGDEQDLSLSLPDTDPILPANDEDSARDAFGTAGPGTDLSSDVAEPAAPAQPPKPPPARVATMEADIPDAHIDEAAFAAADGARFHELKCVEAVPVALDDSGLSLRNGPQVDFTRVDGIAVAAVHGIAAKPVILVDLLLNWTEISDAPLRTVRLRSDQFDPRTLFPGAGGGLEAFRALLDALHGRVGAAPLPDAAAARGRPFKMFPSLAQYEREVLQVER
ncbi:MAG TPA: rhomboid family intramembrane serine protease [Myxococcota bacterium]|nr:rhomboid family intramembrane serine protease [Myxococcota bacterium]